MSDDDADNRLADRHMREVRGWMASLHPRAESHETPLTRAVCTSSPFAINNPAFLVDPRAPVTTAELENEVQQVVAFFRARRVPFYWWSTPSLDPPELPGLLERRGLQPVERFLTSVIRDLEGDVPAPDSSIRIWNAASVEDLAVASRMRALMFRFPKGAELDYFQQAAPAWLDEGRAILSFASLGDGPPGTMGAMIEGAGIGGIYLSATLPAWTGKGLNYALRLHRLQEFRRRGLGKVTGLCGAQSFPLFKRLGFREISSYRIHLGAARRA